MAGEWMLNDRAVDGEIVDGIGMAGIIKVTPFPNRCFTCQDRGKFIADLRASAANSNPIFTEGYGFTAGNETAEALEESGLPSEIFCVIDVMNLEANIRMLGRSTIESQVTAATLGIGFTHVPDDVADLSDPRLAEVVKFVAAHTGPGVPIMIIRRGEGLPEKLIGEICRPHADVTFFPTTKACPLVMKHDTSYEHTEHAHIGKIPPSTFWLKPGVIMEDVKRVCSHEVVARTKGNIPGNPNIRFDSLYGNWSKEDIVTPVERGIITIYWSQKVKIADDVPELEKLIDRTPRPAADRAKTKELLRRDDASRGETVSALDVLMKTIPSEPIVLGGPRGERVAAQLEELQVLKQICHRASVKGEWLIPAISHALKYWMACADYVLANESKLDKDEKPITSLELALSLGWWTFHYQDKLDSGLVAEIKKRDIAKLLRDGTAEGIDFLPRSEEQATAMNSYIRDVQRFIEE